MPRRKKPNATEEEKQQMVRLYSEGRDCPEIAKLMGYTHHRPVAVALQKLGVTLRDASTRALGKGRTAKVMDAYFAEGVVSHKIARIFGLLLTDGNLFNEAGAKCKVSFTCQHADEELVRFFQQEIGGHVRSILDKRTGNRCWHWWAMSKQLYDDLIKLGLTPRKSLTLNIDWGRHNQEFHPSILLGIFEGDGSVFLARRSDGNIRPTATLVGGSDAFLRSIQPMLPGTTLAYNQPKNRKSGWWSLRAGSLKSVLTLLELVYGSHIIHSGVLQRKYVKAMQVLQHIKERIHLSDRIFALEAEGCSTKQIASILDLKSYRSVLAIKRSAGSTV